MRVSSVTPTTSSGETLCRALVTMTTCVSAKRRPSMYPTVISQAREAKSDKTASGGSGNELLVPKLLML